MQNLLMTTATYSLGSHEALFWNDGKLELEQIANQSPDMISERVFLDELEQARLYMLLKEKFQQGGKP